MQYSVSTRDARQFTSMSAAFVAAVGDCAVMNATVDASAPCGVEIEDVAAFGPEGNAEMEYVGSPRAVVENSCRSTGSTRVLRASWGMNSKDVAAQVIAATFTCARTIHSQHTLTQAPTIKETLNYTQTPLKIMFKPADRTE